MGGRSSVPEAAATISPESAPRQADEFASAERVDIFTLPNDVVFQVLTTLTGYEFARLVTVCSAWHSWSLLDTTWRQFSCNEYPGVVPSKPPSISWLQFYRIVANVRCDGAFCWCPESGQPLMFRFGPDGSVQRSDIVVSSAEDNRFLLERQLPDTCSPPSLTTAPGASWTASIARRIFRMPGPNRGA
eukprot:TRINITY_DN3043_c0_g1_i2.p1 TRINITY_DN3043_c0_g1~~TRINITY_DN3043_c0_g1_i2.p1  ORF type:complete len:188 (+),score=37.30 TRINITY_DN3043_c0_g1_i2:55-618(+)